jgi:hypothetical protein
MIVNAMLGSIWIYIRACLPRLGSVPQLSPTLWLCRDHALCSMGAGSVY